MLSGAEKLVPAEYWCPYGTYVLCLANKSQIMDIVSSV